MNSEKLISVIMAAYNSDSYLAECIESIRAQTYPNWELIICDDASTDNTLTIAKHYESIDSRIKVIHNDHNLRAGTSRNKCIELCKGDYIAIQDADDISNPNRLLLLLRKIQEEKTDFVSCAHYLFDDNGRYADYIPKEEFPTKRSFLSGMPFCHAATLFTKACLTNVNGYRVSQHTVRNEDYDLFMRLYAKGYKGCNLLDILYGYRVDKATKRRRTFRFRIDECIIRAEGFRKMGILYPFGWIYIFRPLVAHLYQIIKR